MPHCETKQVCEILLIKALEICNLEENCFMELSDIYSQEEIHVSETHICTDAEIELELNATKLVEPWRVINSQDNGPFAVKTLLG